MAQILPTKGNLIGLKRSRRLAETGYQLMDKKRTILAKEMMQRLETVKTLQAQIDTRFREAYTALALAQRQHPVAGLGEHAAVDESIELRSRSVMGVLILRVIFEPQAAGLPYPLTMSGPSLDEAYLKFYELKGLLLEMAEAETAVYCLAEAMKKTQKRTNALRHIVLPATDADLRRIREALEEKEREEYTRLKKC